MGRSRRLLPVVLGVLVLGIGAGVAWLRSRPLQAPVFFEFPAKLPVGLALSRDGSWVAVGDLQTGIFVWSVEAGAVRREIPPAHGQNFDSIAFDPSDDTLVALDEVLSGDVRTRLATEPFIRRFHVDALGVRQEAAFVSSASWHGQLSPGGEYVAGHTESSAPDRELEIISTRTGKVEHVLSHQHARSPSVFGWSPSGALVWRHEMERTRTFYELEVWRVSDGASVTRVQEPEHVLTVLDPGELCVDLPRDALGYETREIATGRVVQTFKDPRDDDPRHPVSSSHPVVSANGELIAEGTRTVEVRSLRTGKLVASFAAPPGVEGSCSLAFDADGDRLAAAWGGSSWSTSTPPTVGKVAVWKLPR